MTYTVYSVLKPASYLFSLVDYIFQSLLYGIGKRLGKHDGNVSTHSFPLSHSKDVKREELPWLRNTSTNPPPVSYTETKGISLAPVNPKLKK